MKELHEINLKKKMYLLTKAVEAAQNGIVITDKEGRIIYTNPFVSQLTGYSSEELIGQNPKLFKSGNHKPDFYDKMWKTIISGKKWTGEIVNKKKNGELWTELLTITPVTDENDSVEFFIGIQQDVTYKQHLQKNLKETAGELKEFFANKKSKS